MLHFAYLGHLLLLGLGVLSQTQRLCCLDDVVNAFAVSCTKWRSWHVLVPVRRVDEALHYRQLVDIGSGPLAAAIRALWAGAVGGRTQDLQTRAAEAVAAGQLQRPLGVHVEIITADNADWETGRALKMDHR